MKASLRALLTGIVDYAGLFPPARLPLDEAVANYLRYRAEPESWMLGRFVLPVNRLAEMRPLLKEASASGRPMSISGLSSGGTTAAELLAGLKADCRAITEFAQEQGDRASVEVYEVRLPATVLGSEPQEAARLTPLDHLLAETVRVLKEAGCANLSFFFELPLAGNWQGSVKAVSAALKAQEHPHLGMKIRCGGPGPADFPTAGQLAAVIASCRDQAVPFKMTAGLHHPFRRFDAEIGITMHGFVNVFGAAVLAFANRLGEGEIQAIIEDGAAADFVFADEALRWRQCFATTAAIIQARTTFATSFGSCSFAEPCRDLRDLRGYIDRS